MNCKGSPCLANDRAPEVVIIHVAVAAKTRVNNSRVEAAAKAPAKKRFLKESVLKE